jgi:hypothetical protein
MTISSSARVFAGQGQQEPAPSTGIGPANRENAHKSSGPRTAAGKIVITRNAIKHGLLSKTVIFQTEKERAEFQELGNSLVEEFQTVGVNIPSRTKQVEEEAQTRDALAQR